MANEKKKSSTKPVIVPLRFVIPETIITRFASNMVVQTIENEFKVSFFESKPEIHIGPLKDIPKEVKAECVASIIVTVDRMPVFINALQTHFENFKKSREIKEDI